MSMLNFKSTLSSVVAAASLAVSAFASAGYVDLVVSSEADGFVLQIEDSDVKCGNDKHCIQTIKGEEMDIDFRLKKACKNDGPAYRLSEMTLAMIEREPESPGSDVMVKVFGVYDLPPIVRSDFNTDAKGQVLWTNHNRLADDKIRVRDKNDGEYVVYYQIKASKCPGNRTAGPDHIFLDPRVKNTGK